MRELEILFSTTRFRYGSSPNEHTYSQCMNTIIFTDLDGTLLHPETYSFEAARPALEAIKDRGIPLVLCSSKTRAELEWFSRLLNNQHPYISENGGGVFIPLRYFRTPVGGEIREDHIEVRLGLPYARIRREFCEIRSKLRAPVTGFGDMDVDAVAAATGLSLDQASLARNRDFSEPFLGLEEGAAGPFLQAAEARGLHWTRGRLYCLMGPHDKGRAARMLIKWYENEHGKIVSIGLGDALNDLPLLIEMDERVLVQKRDGTYDQDVVLAGLRKAPGIGPEGWNKAVLELLNREERTADRHI